MHQSYEAQFEKAIKCKDFQSSLEKLAQFFQRLIPVSVIAEIPERLRYDLCDVLCNMLLCPLPYKHAPLTVHVFVGKVMFGFKICIP